MAVDVAGKTRKEVLAELHRQMLEVADEAEAKGRQLITAGREQVALGSRLLHQAQQLRDEGAEAIDPRAGVDDVERSVGAKGEVKLEVAIGAAIALGTFTRRQFADELGLKPVQGGRWITALLDRTIIQRTDDGHAYRYCHPDVSDVFAAA